MFTEFKALTGLLKNLRISEKNAAITSAKQKLPAQFVALVKKVGKELVLLEWGSSTFYAGIEVPVKEGELLLLKLREESQGKQFYRVLARSSAEGRSAETMIWHVFSGQEGKTQPSLFKVRYAQQQRGRGYSDEADGPSLEIGFQTQNLGFIVVRVSSFAKPYVCRLLVEKAEYGELLQPSLAAFRDQLDEEALPINLLPYKIVSANIFPSWSMGEKESSLFLDKKA